MASLFGGVAGAPTLSGLSNVDANSLSIGPILISEDGTITGATSVDTTTITATNLSGTLTTASQPNITSVGTLPTATITNLTSTIVNSTNLLGLIQTSSQPYITSIGTLPSATIISLTVFDVNGTNLYGLIQTGFQPNITYIGTLTGGLNIASGQTYKINAVDVLTATTLGSNIINSSLRNIVPSTNVLYIGDTTTNQYIEIAPNTALIDFISSGSAGTDYNARIRCTGGTATTGTGTLTYTANTHRFQNQSAINQVIISNAGQITNSANVENAFYHNIGTAQTYTKPFTGLNSVILDGQSVMISIGRSQSTNGCVEIAHNYNGTTASSNKCTIGFYGNGPLFSIDQNGDSTIYNNLQIGGQGAGYGVYNPTNDKQLLEGYPCTYQTPANNRTNRYGHYRWTKGGGWANIPFGTTTYDIPFSGFYNDALVPVGSGTQENCSGIWKLYISKKSPSANGQAIYIYSFAKITGVTGFGSLSLIHSNSRGWSGSITIGAGTGDNIRVSFNATDVVGSYIYMNWTTEGCI